MEWISVKDRLPKNGKYLVLSGFTTDYEVGITTSYYENGEWGIGSLTHWMPLPEPPKEEG